MSSATEPRLALPPRYRVIRHIAHGGMASVWAVQDELLSRLVAVKVLGPAYAEDERAVRRFMREARAGARLSDCRHVVTVYDIGEYDGRPFMVMEHFAGGTVADRLRAQEPIPRTLAVRWLHEASEALDCAHANAVVHRDVKPANLLLDESDGLAVGDFGIATVATEASVTQTGQVLGTAAYISPEQARGEPATPASDRYALAVVAYELLTGDRPFAATHPAAQARAHVEATVPLASRRDGDLPHAVDEVLRAGLAKEPRERPATARRFVELLEAALAEQDEPRHAAAAATQVRAPRAPRTVALPPPRTRVRRRPIALALAALALAALATLAIAATGTDGDGERSAAAPTSTSDPTSTSTPASTAPAETPQSEQPAVAPDPQPTPPAEDAVALNDQGKALIDAGSSGEAIAPLERSVTAYRQQGRTGELGYAFALYNLGNALRLAGRPAEAIPFLQERLQVSGNQRGTVSRELALAQEQAGLAPTPKGNGKRDKGWSRGDEGDD
jgi:tetratricopeptide (TPR) repeat protein